MSTTIQFLTDLPHQSAYFTRAHRPSPLRPSDALAVQGRMAADAADQDHGEILDTITAFSGGFY